MHDVQTWKRQRALDLKVLEQRMPRAAESSAVLSRVFGYDQANDPFDAPPPLPTADGASSGPSATTGPSAGTRQAPTAGLAGPHSQHLGPATAFGTQVTGSDAQPHPPADREVQQAPQSHPVIQHGHGPRRKPTRRKYHPDLLSFKFPAAPVEADVETEVEMGDATAAGGVDPEASVAAPGRDPQLLGETFDRVPEVPLSAVGSEFDVYEDAHATDVKSEPSDDSNKTVYKTVLNDLPTMHKNAGNFTSDDDASQSLPQNQAAAGLQPAQAGTQRNVVPDLEAIFDQHFRFGRTEWEGARLLRPREIQIDSITARTNPCWTDPASGVPQEKSAKLFTLVAGKDVAEIKMFEVEVLSPAGNAPSHANVFRIDRGIYHETSSSNPNAWTLLFIREKAQRYRGSGNGEPDQEEMADAGFRVHAAKKVKRRVTQQGPDFGPPMLGEGVDGHPWQMLAWPSAHSSSVLEIMGPDPQGAGSAARAPLAPKVIQLRQQQQQDGDAQLHVEHKAAGHARGRMRPLDGDGDNSPSSLQQQIACFKVDVVDCYQKRVSVSLADLSLGTLCNDNEVLVQEGQLLTCVRLERGGKYPLLTGSGVDLNYWNAFCKYFCQGELQIDALTSADSDPVIISGEERWRRTGKGRARNTSAQQDNLNDANDWGKKAATSGPGPSRRGGSSAADTAMPDALSGSQQHHPDQPGSTPLLQKDFSPFGIRNGILQQKQHGAQSAQDPQSTSSSHDRTSIHDNDDPTAAALLQQHGWQIELLDALQSRRAPAWHNWTARSPAHAQRRANQHDHAARLAAAAAASCHRSHEEYWPTPLVVLGETRARRDVGNPYFGAYADEVVPWREEARLERAGRPGAWMRPRDAAVLRRWEGKVQPEEYMEAVRAEQGRREVEREEDEEFEEWVRKERERLKARAEEKVKKWMKKGKRGGDEGGKGGGAQPEPRSMQSMQGQWDSGMPVKPQPLRGQWSSGLSAQPQSQPDQQSAVFDHGAYDPASVPRHMPSTDDIYGAQQQEHSNGPYYVSQQQLLLPYSQPYTADNSHYRLANHNQQAPADLSPAIQHGHRAPNTAAAATPAAQNREAQPSYFIWQHRPGAEAAGTTAEQRTDARSMENVWTLRAKDQDDEDEDDEEDEYYETGWY